MVKRRVVKKKATRSRRLPPPPPVEPPPPPRYPSLIDLSGPEVPPDTWAGEYPPPEFTTDWVEGRGHAWTHWLASLTNQPVSALELGTFEGRSALWFLRNVLTHPASLLTCVDAWSYDYTGGFGQEQLSADSGTTLEDARQRCLRNLRPYMRRGRCAVVTMNTQEFLRTRRPEQMFKLIYVDASHYASCVLEDTIAAWWHLAQGGIMIWDDYEWVLDHRQDKHELGRPKLAIDAFLSVFEEQYEVLGMGYQVCIRRTTKNPFE